MQSSSTMKIKFSALILLVGLVSGSLLALSLWFDISSQLYRALAWICFGILALLSFALLRRASRRSFIILTALASASIIYLFPQLFAPACNGMPIAFAGHPGCTRECDEDCYIWDAEGQCARSKIICWWECPDPNPDQPPSVSESVVCDQWGSGGWCRNNARLSLSASDPQGYAVSISGTAGTAFSCGASCAVSLPPGIGTATYTATSATSDMTVSGATAWYYDPQPPIPGINLSGTSGLNGWYVSDVSVVANAWDAISGLASAALSVDGGAMFSSTIISADGVHSLNETATDHAGNSATTSLTVKVDTTPPQVVSHATGTPGSNGWYISPVQVSASASDAASGLAWLMLNIDGVWSTYTSPIVLGNGLHTVQFRASDNAGNVTTTTAQILRIDTTAPVIAAVVTGANGSNGWYVSNVNTSASGSDSISGLASATLSVDGGAAVGSSVLTDGVHSVTATAIDIAGNTSSKTLTISVDTTAPIMNASRNGTSGKDGWYTSTVDFQITATDATSGPQYGEYRIDGGIWKVGMMFAVSGDGIHTVEYRVFDQAGNVSAQSETIQIDTTPPAYNFDAALNGSVLADTVSLGGTVADGTSGLHDVEFSSDGITWIAASFAGAQWSFDWDSAVFDNGERELFLRADDWAGNAGQPISVRVILDNVPPYVKLAETWNIWESGSLSVQKNVIPLKSVKITVHDPLQRYPDEVIFYALPAPTAVAWDRVIGPASAPPGSYTVLVEACDIYGLCSKDSGTVVIPVEPALIPFQLPEIKIPEWIPPIPFFTQPPAPAPELPIVLPVVVVPIPAEVQLVPSQAWITIVISAFLLAFALLLVLDPRPSAWRSLTRQIADALIT